MQGGECMEIDGTKLRSIRKERGLTQKQLANGICTAAMISLVERNMTTPSDYLVMRLCGRLGVLCEDIKRIK